MLPSFVAFVLAVVLHVVLGGHHQAHSFGRRAPLPDLDHDDAAILARSPDAAIHIIEARQGNARQRCDSDQFRNNNGRCVDCPDHVATCTSLTTATSCERGYRLVSSGTGDRRSVSCVRNPATPPVSRDVVVAYYGCIASAEDGSVDSDVVSSSGPDSAAFVVAQCYEFIGGGTNRFSTYCFFDGGGVYLTDDLGSVATIGRNADGNCNTRCGGEFCGGTRGGGVFYSVYELVDTTKP